VPAPHGAAVPHWTPEYPALHAHEPPVGLLFRHVPCPLQTVEQFRPVEHGLQTHVEFKQSPLPVQSALTVQGPDPTTRRAGSNVKSVLPITIAATQESTARPDEFCMWEASRKIGPRGTLVPRVGRCLVKSGRAPKVSELFENTGKGLTCTVWAGRSTTRMALAQPFPSAFRPERLP
jgi:hypothetical protein